MNGPIPRKRDVVDAFNSFGAVWVHHIALKKKLGDSGFDYAASAAVVGEMIGEGSLVLNDRTGEVRLP